MPFRAHFGQRGPGGLRRVDGEESRAALPGWTRRQMKGERRRRNSNSREKRRREVVSSADYGDFVVSEGRRESQRCVVDILLYPSFVVFIFILPLFSLSLSFVVFSSCTTRSFVTTSSEYGRFVAGTSLVTGAILRRSHPISINRFHREKHNWIDKS